MSRTIGHHLPGDAPRDETTFECDYCGSWYYRSELRRDRAGYLACPKDLGGDIVTLSEENAAGAQRPLVQPDAPDGGNIHIPPVETPPTVVFPDGVAGFTS